MRHNNSWVRDRLGKAHIHDSRSLKNTKQHYLQTFSTCGDQPQGAQSLRPFQILQFSPWIFPGKQSIWQVKSYIKMCVLISVRIWDKTQKKSAFCWLDYSPRSGTKVKWKSSTGKSCQWGPFWRAGFWNDTRASSHCQTAQRPWPHAWDSSESSL